MRVARTVNDPLADLPRGADVLAAWHAQRQRRLPPGPPLTDPKERFYLRLLHWYGRRLNGN